MIRDNLNQYKDKNFDIIVLAGQSNAEGLGIGEVSTEYEKNEKILWLNDNSNPYYYKDELGRDVLSIDTETDMYVEVAEEKMKDGNICGNFALTFAKNYFEKFLTRSDRELLIIHTAVGGTGFSRSEWGLNNVLYNRLNKMLSTALSLNDENKVVAFLWHQGEHDAFENASWDNQKRYTTHLKNLTEMFSDFKSKYNLYDIPFIAGTFCNEWYVEYKEKCDAIIKAVNEVFSSPNERVVETKELLSNNQKTGNGDKIHFCRESLHLLGEKYFKAYLDIKSTKE